MSDPNLLEEEAMETARSALKYWAQTTGMVTEPAEMRKTSRLTAHSAAAFQRANHTYPADIDFGAPLNADLPTTDELRALVPQKKQGRGSGSWNKQNVLSAKNS